MDNIAVVLAGGKGTRMKRKSKVLETLCGKPIISHIVDKLKEINLKIVVVIGVESEIPNLLGESVEYVVQNEPLGTGHALLLASEYISKIHKKQFFTINKYFNTKSLNALKVCRASITCLKNKEIFIKNCVKFNKNSNFNVLIINGDGPFVNLNILKSMLYLNICDMKVLVGCADKSSRFGRIIRNNDGEIIEIIEAKDCSNDEINITEVNLGLYCVKNSILQKNIKKLSKNNAQNEYYATDLVQLVYNDGGKIESVNVDNNSSAKGAMYLSVNDLNELDAVEREMQSDLIAKLRASGVRFIGDSIVDCYSKIGSFSTIHAFCNIEKSTVCENVEIFSHCSLCNSKIEENVKIYNSCTILNCEIGENVKIGAGCVLENFKIEKNTTVESGCILKGKFN